jgi:hypothetical protein
MITTEYQINTETKLKRIAWLSSQDKGKRFNNLMHLFNRLLSKLDNDVEWCYKYLI